MKNSLLLYWRFSRLNMAPSRVANCSSYCHTMPLSVWYTSRNAEPSSLAILIWCFTFNLPFFSAVTKPFQHIRHAGRGIVQPGRPAQGVHPVDQRPVDLDSHYVFFVCHIFSLSSRPAAPQGRRAETKFCFVFWLIISLSLSLFGFCFVSIYNIYHILVLSI